MKLVVGLGNIGEGYAKTRHNAGFIILDSYAAEKGLVFTYSKYCKGEVAATQECVFLKPSTYMNLSGGAVKAAKDFFGVQLEDILIVADDVESPFGAYKLKKEGGAKGHNGLRSIEASLGTKAYARLWIGISRDDRMPLDQYVLAPFKAEELEKLKEEEDKIHQAIDEWILGVTNV
ncbi:MAG: aminoacyl-tRNA hydrolase [Chlamydiae bacterium]|nr:aminoacyl-tRNA hydrolase [Chlamydiota bacterium]